MPRPIVSTTLLKRAAKYAIKQGKSAKTRARSLVKRPRQSPKAALRKLRAHTPKNEAALRSAYAASPMAGAADTFVLCRIIGNDLVPRHASGQSRENLAFILENESAFEGCEKLWIVNRILDREEEARIIALLERYEQDYIRLAFDPEHYAQIDFDFETIARESLLSARHASLDGAQKERANTALYRLKNLYVMNNNGARNIALEEGRKRAKWVLPWDGNCFLTAEAWRSLKAGVLAKPHLKYFMVPMARIVDNAKLLEAGFATAPVEEPQIVFRRDAVERFDTALPYGRRPKVELFWRLGVPGKWNRWRDDPRDQPREPVSEDAGAFGTAGWVARIFSGAAHLENADPSSFKGRGLARQQAIVAALDRADQHTLVRALPHEPELGYFTQSALTRARQALDNASESALGLLAARVVADAEAALSKAPLSVLDKTGVAPSGDPQDYWHPAPYWWPDPTKSSGLPYVKRDGQRVPGTVMYAGESVEYDRTHLQLTFERSLALALAWRLTGRAEFAEHGAKLIRTWFIDPATGMNPHLRYAQVRMGHNANEGNSTGLIEFKDFYYVLDAVRLLESSGALTKADSFAFRTWLSDYHSWLSSSAQGEGERAARNNHGTYFDVQSAAIQSYLAREPGLLETLGRAGQRIAYQFNEDGTQPAEIARTTSQHYCFFNLQGWLTLTQIARNNGIAAHRWAGLSLDRLIGGVRWVLQQDLEHWPYAQINTFDKKRLAPLKLSARHADLGPIAEDANALMRVKPHFDPHDAIAPYWNLMAATLEP